MDDRCSRLIALDSLFREELSWFTHLRPGSGDIATMPVESKVMTSLNSDKYLVTFKLNREGAPIKTLENDVKLVEGNKKNADSPQNVMDVWKKPYGWFFLPGEKIPIVE